MATRNFSSVEGQNFYNVTLESCSGKYEDYQFPVDRRK